MTNESKASEATAPQSTSEGSKATAGYVSTAMGIAAPNSAKADTSYMVLSADDADLWEVVGNITARDPDAAKLAYCESVKDFKEAVLVAVAAKFWKPSTVKAQTVTTTTLVLGEAS